MKNGRGERIRTSDPLVPNQVLYQAEPLPEHGLMERTIGERPGAFCPSECAPTSVAESRGVAGQRPHAPGNCNPYFFSASAGRTAPGKMPSSGARFFSSISGWGSGLRGSIWSRWAAL